MHCHRIVVGNNRTKVKKFEGKAKAWGYECQESRLVWDKTKRRKGCKG